MTAIRVARTLAAAIERQPGALEADLVSPMTGSVVEALPVLRSWGYRDIAEPPDDDGTRRTVYEQNWRWWPSPPRCAELARTADGDRRERLLQGMLL